MKKQLRTALGGVRVEVAFGEAPFLAAKMRRAQRFWRQSVSGAMSVSVEAAQLHMNGIEGPKVKKTRLEGAALRVKRLTEHARLPSRGSPHAAGYDLYRCVSCVLSDATGPSLPPLLPSLQRSSCQYSRTGEGVGAH